MLAPNEYAYVLDTTKGHVNCYVGPNKTSLAQTDQPVRFDEPSKRFTPCELSEGICLFATAPASWYVVLENPAKDGSHPRAGASSSLVDLDIGRKIHVPGPATFALWPGQLARVIAGHTLASSQYLWVRVYDPEQAERHSREALGLGGEKDGPPPRLVAGHMWVIRGTHTAFYVPPTGVEVVPDERPSYVRDAVTLARLEYCVLVGEDGKKTYVRGEAVVFPAPDQRFLEQGGQRRFKAIELSEITGLYVKVIAPYTDDDGTAHKEGEELFLTGKDRIYFPREEHAIIRYGSDSPLHQAIAIPRGEGRYVLDRLTGEVALVTGPRMLLPDPRREVVVRRVLSERECRRLFPHNEEVVLHNRALAGAGVAPGAPEGKGRATAAPGAARAASTVQADGAAPGTEDGGFVGADFARPSAFKRPRAITLDTRYEGALSVDVWSGYAVQVVDKSGARRVVAGPATVLLGYDETLDALALSTGTPKRGDALLETAFLQISGNKVSDVVSAMTRDLVRVSLELKYRVSFEGEDRSRWFAVDNYVQLLVDHARSKLRAAVQKLGIRELRQRAAELVRDALLGVRDERGERVGLRFAECAMRVYDVEVLDVTIADAAVSELLAASELSAVTHANALAEREEALARDRRLAEIERDLAREGHATRVAALELDAALRVRAHAEDELALARRNALATLGHESELREAELVRQVRTLELATRKAEHESDLARRADLQRLAIEELAARVAGTVQQAQAFTPQLVAVLERVGDQKLLASLSENFGELAAIEGKGLLETARKFLDFVPASMVPRLKNGDGS